jgi:hypothetical protein
MKDLEYGLIDTVKNKIKENKELISLLILIEKRLIKGFSNAEEIIEYKNNINILGKIGFVCEEAGEYQFIFTGKRKKYYKIKIAEKL